MNAPIRTVDPLAARRIHVRAMISHIDAMLGRGGDALPFRPADRLLAALVESEVAVLHDQGEVRTLCMYTVAVTADCAAHGLLRNWQGRAKDWLGERA